MTKTNRTNNCLLTICHSQSRSGFVTMWAFLFAFRPILFSISEFRITALNNMLEILLMSEATQIMQLYSGHCSCKDMNKVSFGIHNNDTWATAAGRQALPTHMEMVVQDYFRSHLNAIKSHLSAKQKPHKQHTNHSFQLGHSSRILIFLNSVASSLHPVLPQQVASHWLKRTPSSSLWLQWLLTKQPCWMHWNDNVLDEHVQSFFFFWGGGFLQCLSESR